jgi:hypothetical protein
MCEVTFSTFSNHDAMEICLKEVLIGILFPPALLTGVALVNLHRASLQPAQQRMNRM